MQKRKMKFWKLLLAAPLVTMFIGCDKVDEPDRFIEVEAVKAKRTVLLEEFTGQRCVNCPDAHAIINTLREQYGESFIPVSIHGGPKVFLISYAEGQEAPKIGLKDPDGDGDYYASYHGVTSSLPIGVINRTSGLVNYNQWAGILATELEKETNVDIEVSASLSEDGSKINVSTTLKPTANITGHLQLWVLESGIVAQQIVGNTMDMTYVHNHVYRANVNGREGEAVTLKENIYSSFTNTADVRSYWNPNNLSIVAFVYNSEGVLQAAECEVATGAESQE
jgi:hypothetical protein